MARFRDVLILDNNTIRKLEHDVARTRLLANLKATGREFWPSAMNVLEALKERDPRERAEHLRTLHTLAGDSYVLSMPTDALKEIAQSYASDNDTVTWAEPRLTALMRRPEHVTAEQVSAVRTHFRERERDFDSVQERAGRDIIPLLKAKGGRDRWPDLGAFLDEVWSTPSHLSGYLTGLWKIWAFPGRAPVRDLLGDRCFRLYLEGWGATMYARHLAHPQFRRVEHADLLQLVYAGSAKSTVLVSDDRGFRDVANAILRGRYAMMEAVPFACIVA